MSIHRSRSRSSTVFSIHRSRSRSSTIFSCLCVRSTTQTHYNCQNENHNEKCQKGEHWPGPNRTIAGKLPESGINKLAGNRVPSCCHDSSRSSSKATSIELMAPWPLNRCESSKLQATVTATTMLPATHVKGEGNLMRE
jgi:hypothetical protein